MNEIFPTTILTALSEEITTAGLDKSKIPIKNLDLIPKDQLILIILDVLDQYTKQTSIEKCSQFFIQYTLKKYNIKPQAAKFCQSLEYSIEAHSKSSREPRFLQYLFSMDNNRDVIKFYLKSRKILMQFFFDDGSYRYHDAETTHLELEQWVNVATRIFADISSSRSVERLNNVVVRHAVQISSNKIRKTIDAVSFLEHCTIEFLRVKGFIQDKGTGANRSVSPINRTLTPKKNESPVKDKTPPSKNAAISTPGKDLNVSQNRYPSPPRGNLSGSKSSSVAKIDFSSPNTYKVQKQTADFGRPILSGDNEGREGEHMYDYEERDMGNITTDQGMRRSPPIQDRSLNDLKKEKRFLVGELAEQNNERKRIEDNLEKVLGEFSDLSDKHDHLVDFTMELHKNFLFLMDYLKAKNSVLMEDTEVQEMYNKLNTFNSYEKNHIDKLNKTGMFQNREHFLENMKKENKKGSPKKPAH